jgi:hypothetical protein
MEATTPPLHLLKTHVSPRNAPGFAIFNDAHMGLIRPTRAILVALCEG